MLIEHLLISDPTAHHTTVTRTRYSHHYCPGNITYLSTNIFRFMQQNERKTVANSAYINAKRKKWQLQTLILSVTIRLQLVCKYADVFNEIG